MASLTRDRRARTATLGELEQRYRDRSEREQALGSDAKHFAQGLQKAGYATDPAYADKLGKVINTTLRLQRSLA